MNEVNHRYDDFGSWVDYTGFRYKDYYNVKTKKGDTLLCCFPNGNTFWRSDSPFGIPDSEVAMIQLATDRCVLLTLGNLDISEERRAERNREQFEPHCNETHSLEVTVKVRIDNACSRSDAFMFGGYKGISEKMIEEEGLFGIVDPHDVEVIDAKEVKQ